MSKWSVALILSGMVLSGCMGQGSDQTEANVEWSRGMVQIPLDGLDDVRNFSVGIAFENQTVGESNWAVFGNEEGGNCCEHYLAMTKEGWILNFGGNIQLGRMTEAGHGRNTNHLSSHKLGAWSPNPPFRAKKGWGRVV